MKENNAGLKSNLEKVDSHAISPVEYTEIPELPEEFFTEGQLYRNGKPVERRSRDKQKEPTKKQLSIGNLHLKNRIALAPMTKSRAGSARVPCVKGLLCE